jgi:hypothetical protein
MFNISKLAKQQVKTSWTCGWYPSTPRRKEKAYKKNLSSITPMGQKLLKGWLAFVVGL